MMIKRWRFYVEDFDGHGATVDVYGGPDGEYTDQDFIGASAQACDEGDRRADLWTERTGRDVAKITCESRGSVMPNVQIEGLRAFAQSLSNAVLGKPCT